MDVSAQTAVAAVQTYEEVIRASQQASLSAQQADDTLRQIVQVTLPELIPMITEPEFDVQLLSMYRPQR